MALFENYERRADKINAVLCEYGISSIEECKDITVKAGIDCDKIVRETQPICFENAVWAYTVGTAIAVKKGCTKASDAVTITKSPVQLSTFARYSPAGKSTVMPSHPEPFTKTVPP